MQAGCFHSKIFWRENIDGELSISYTYCMNTATSAQKIRFNRETTLQEIVLEIRALRTAVDLLVPSENLRDYAHPRRIAASYKRAVKLHSPKS